MRPIKFRAKNSINGKWVYGVPVRSNCGLCLVQRVWHIDGAEYNVDERMVDPDTIGQFTGLLDKNGREIYEGDIVEYENGNAGYGRPRHQEISRDVIPNITEHDEYIDGAMWWKTGEVIGNIHDNPELLEVTP